MTRRALTLIEMLIVVALLAALAAIAMAITVPMLSERAFDRASDVAVHHLLLARAHARETRGAIEVVRLADPPRLVTRRFDPAMPEADAGAALETIVDEGWAVADLPAGILVTRARPLSERDGPAFDAATEDEGGADAGVLRLVVFLPDGSVLLGGTFWLTDEDGRTARVDLHPWTGTPTIERVTATAPLEEPDRDEADETPTDERPGDEDPLPADVDTSAEDDPDPGANP